MIKLQSREYMKTVWRSWYEEWCCHWNLWIFVNTENMTSDTGAHMRLWDLHNLAPTFYNNKKILSHKQFNEIDWRFVHCTLHNLLHLFQLWVAKHVLGITGMMKFLSYQDGQCTRCPTCRQCKETCSHITRCPDLGRALAIKESVHWKEGSTGSEPIWNDMPQSIHTGFITHWNCISSASEASQ